MTSGTRPTRVLYLVTDDWYFLSHRLPLAKRMLDLGAEVTVVTGDTGQAEEIEAQGFLHIAFDFRRTLSTQALNLLALRRLTKIYRRVRPDLCHHVSFLPVVFGSLAARRASVPAVVNAVTGLGHAFVAGSAPRRALRWMVERAYRTAFRQGHQIALFQNVEDRELFVGQGLVAREDSELIPGSGVDTQRFQPSEGAKPEPPRVLHASRMLWTKGVGDSVEAARMLRERGVDFVFSLAGRTHASNPEAIPEKQLESWAREGTIEWLGHRTDVPSLLAGACVACLPSRYREGVPMALLEACSAGLPIVTTDVPGCREVVEHGVNGFLVQSGRPVELADALERLLRDPSLRREMGARSRERAVRLFDQEIVLQRTLGCYARLDGTLFPHGRALSTPHAISRRARDRGASSGSLRA